MADWRYWVSLHDTHACGTVAEAQEGNAKELLVPGSPEMSLISVRPHAGQGYFRMPPLGTIVVDDAGVGVLDQWITSLTSCP